MSGDLFHANGCDFIADRDMIVAHCRKGNIYEPTTTAFLGAHLRRGGVFIDIGAGTGWFSIPAARAGCRVIAFEPNPKCADRLEANAALNQAEIELHIAAVSDHSGVAELHFNAQLELTSGASIEPGACLVPSGKREVQCLALDDIQMPRPNVIKVDVEGHEGAVLRGAARLIDTTRPALVLEANTQAARAHLVMWLVANEYRWQTADDRNLLCLPRS